ncbi:hypothetical protein, partial [Iodobacter sp.]|uniref:hypothetical protein n=1 Tax=Iodobacter sp. TaxID=1915058 RepID=UPI0025E45CB9
RPRKEPKEGRPNQHEIPSLRIIGSAKKAARSLPRYPFSETPIRLFLVSACFKGGFKPYATSRDKDSDF